MSRQSKKSVAVLLAILAASVSLALFSYQRTATNPSHTGSRGLFAAAVAQAQQANVRLDYSTYVGGNHADEARAVAVDQAGNIYIAGSTNSTNFPVVNGVQTSFNGPATIEDIFVIKLGAAGGAAIYSTYFGGHGTDLATGIAVDAAGNAYVTGRTSSADFPVTSEAFQKTGGGEDCFVVKLSPSGAIVYATLLGGSGAERGNGIAVDAAGNAYVAGKTTSPDFPVSGNALQNARRGFEDAFVTKLNAAGSALLYSTYLGGDGDLDEATGIAVDALGNAYVAGSTASENFPTTANAIQNGFGGGTVFFGDGFISKLNATGEALVYSTYLGGGRGDRASAIAVDAAGNAYVTGTTESTNFPTRNAMQNAKAGDCADNFSNCLDAFVVKLDATGAQLLYSTYLGGGSRATTVNGAGDAGVAIAADGFGNAYVSGTTASDDFPVLAAAQMTRGGNGDGFVTRLSATGELAYSTYLGGVGDESAHAIAVDQAGNAYVAGIATAPGFPTTTGAFQAAFAGSFETAALARDGFVARLFHDLPLPSPLRITGATVSGKRLFVEGENFAEGALIFINGDKQKKTDNDAATPTTRLIGRKAGKWISIGQPVILQVRNPDGMMSPPFVFTRQN